MTMNTEQASRLVLKELQEMPVAELVAEIHSNQNSQLAITVRNIVDFSKRYYKEEKAKTYLISSSSLTYAPINEGSYKSFTAANTEPFTLAAS